MVSVYHQHRQSVPVTARLKARLAMGSPVFIPLEVTKLLLAELCGALKSGTGGITPYIHILGTSRDELLG